MGNTQNVCWNGIRGVCKFAWVCLPQLEPNVTVEFSIESFHGVPNLSDLSPKIWAFIAR